MTDDTTVIEVRLNDPNSMGVQMTQGEFSKFVEKWESEGRACGSEKVLDPVIGFSMSPPKFIVSVRPTPEDWPPPVLKLGD